MKPNILGPTVIAGILDPVSSLVLALLACLPLLALRKTRAREQPARS